MKLGYFDIESTAIPPEGVLYVDTIHCIGVKVNDSQTLMYTSRFLPLSNYGGTLKNAVDILNSCDYIVGHNILFFDCIVIENLLAPLTAKRLDTLIISKLCYTKDELLEHDYSSEVPKELYGRFSLEAFGYRLHMHKGSYSDWSKLTVAMCDYCTQDVEVTYALYQTLLESSYYPSESTIELENEVAYLIAQQQFYGFYYDIDAGRKLMQSLMYEQLSIELRLAKTFRPLYLPDGQPVIPAGARRNKIYLPNENYKGF